MSIENRLAAKKRAKQAKSRRIRNKILKVVAICLIPIIICVVGYFIFMSRLEKNVDNSSYINANGKIKARAAGNYATVCDYRNISVNRDDYLPTESEVQAQIDKVLNADAETVKTKGTEIESDSIVNLTFKVTVDGKEVEALERNDSRYTLGSNTMTETFDKAIAKLKVGDDFSINVSFPSDFSNADVAGKNGVFEGNVVSVQVVPEFTDEYVSKNLAEDMEGSDFPKTAEGYRKFVADVLYKNALESYVSSYIVDNTTIKSYPFLYLKAQYYLRDKTYQYYVNSYNQMFGSQIYGSPVDLLGLDSKSTYKKQLNDEAKSVVAGALAYQAIFEDAGLPEITEDTVKAYIKESENSTYDELVESYGYNYLAQITLQHEAFEYVMSLVSVNGDTNKMWKPDPATGADATAK